MNVFKKLSTIACVVIGLTSQVQGQAVNSSKLAKDLSNPISNLISVPFQLNYDEGYGANGDGKRWVMNIQPVVPFSLGEDWNLISRTILPVISQSDMTPGAGSQTGLGDTVQSFFLSPSGKSQSGWIWGAGAVLLLPTGSDPTLSAKKWGLGPTAVALKQEGPWTYGGLFNHIWSVAGDNSRPDINSTFLQPFVSYTTPTAWSYTLNSESTFDWETDQWSVPINAIVSKVVTLGKQPVSLSLGARYWVESSDTGPEGWGARFATTFMFPK